MGLCQSNTDDFEMPNQFTVLDTYPYNKRGYNKRRRAKENKQLQYDLDQLNLKLPMASRY
jgi:hypothetical protein